MMSRLGLFTVTLLVLTLTVNQFELHAAEPPVTHIGYTEFRANLPGGRHANVKTMRACVVKTDGTDRRMFVPELSQESDSWTQFARWSPDGTIAVVGRGWQSPENAEWEEKNKNFRHVAGGYLYDSYLVDYGTLKATNVTAVDRVSFYNAGVFFWPKDPTKLGFTALIDGNSHPFRMDLDGQHKTDLTKESKEFAYGFSSSPDGKRIAYHMSYQTYVADADGSHATRIETGQPFNFAPSWSPDGKWVLFVSGEHYNCHPVVAKADGTGLKKIADRAGYRGVVEFLDVPDFHGGSSDIPVWSTDGKSVFYTAKVDDSVELFRVSLDGKNEQLTKSKPGTLHYHPQPAADGQRLLYGSKRDGIRQIFVRNLTDGSEQQITGMQSGHGAMWAHWQPQVTVAP